MTFGLDVMGMVVIFVVVPVADQMEDNILFTCLTYRQTAEELQHALVHSPDTMLLLMIFPPRVARDLGTTVMMLPLVVLT